MQIRNKTFLATTTVLFSSFLISSAPAFAHAHLKKSDPAKGSVLKVEPKEVTLHFSEELEPVLCRVSVKDVAGGQVVSEGKPKPAGNDMTTLQVALKPLSPKKTVYVVKWNVVSKDTHRMKGSYRFTYDPKEQ